ncbi:MAG TPA: hypothetical protein VNG89_21170 [Vicinamibacterales bacterium]|nr:hypothetical protein [Vicinamibacterales bacterium]
MPDSAVELRADQISATPSWPLTRLASVQVSPPPATVFVSA